MPLFRACPARPSNAFRKAEKARLSPSFPADHNGIAAHFSRSRLRPLSFALRRTPSGARILCASGRIPRPGRLPFWRAQRRDFCSRVYGNAPTGCVKPEASRCTTAPGCLLPTVNLVASGSHKTGYPVRMPKRAWWAADRPVEAPRARRAPGCRRGRPRYGEDTAVLMYFRRIAYM